MNALLEWLALNAVIAAAMVPLVLVACRLFRDRPAVQHVLWLVVLVKLVTPPVIAWPWTLEDVYAAIAPAPPADLEPVAADPVIPPDIAAGSPIPNLPALDPFAPGSDAEPAALPIAAESPDVLAVALPAVAAVWLAGAALCLIRQARRIARHAALVRRGEPAPSLVANEVASVARQLGVKPPPTLTAAGILSPFVWCLGRLRLIWPAALASREDLQRSRGVIAHELAHVRRGDHWVAWLELAAGIVWWWNPLYWLVRRRLRESAEMACDALAIGADPDGRRAYAEMLLELSSGFKSGMPAPVLAVSAGTPSSFERRLSMILSERVSGKTSWLGIVTAILLAAAALPGWSLAQPKELPRLPSPADDAQLRDLIEKGQFGAAKACLEALRAKQAEDAAKAKAALVERLPAECREGVMKQAVLNVKLCMSCHSKAHDANPKAPLHQPGRPFRFFVEETEVVVDPRQPVADLVVPPGVADPLAELNRGGRVYRLRFEGQAGTLTASNDAGKTLWKTLFADALPKRTPSDRWLLAESKDGKVAAVTLTRKDGRTQYLIDAANGKLMLVMLTMPSDLEAPAGTSGTAADLKQANAALQAARGRLYLLTASANSAQQEIDAARAAVEDALTQREALVAGVRDRLKSAEAASVAARAEYEHMLSIVNPASNAGAALVGKRKRADELESKVRTLRELLATLPPPSAAAFQAQATITAAEAQRALAEAQYQRALKLHNAGALSEKDLDTAKANLKVADAHLALAKVAATARPAAGDMRDDAGPTAAKRLDTLDLAERYLQAVADQKKARTRVDLLIKRPPGTTSQEEISNAEIELERANRRQRFLAQFIGDALQAGKAERFVALTEFRRAEELAMNGALSQSQLAASRAKLDAAELRLKQLQSVMELTVPPAAPKAAPPPPPGKAAERTSIYQMAVKHATDIYKAGGKNAEVTDLLYKAVLNRSPTKAEADFCTRYLASMAAEDRHETAIANIIYQLAFGKEALNK